MENQTMLTPLITSAFGIVLSLVVELVPGFARWWDAMENEKKRSIRGLVGLLIVVLAALGHYFQLYDLGIGTAVNFTGIFILAFSWVSFVIGGEAAYQSSANYLPRKSDNPRYMAKV